MRKLLPSIAFTVLAMAATMASAQTTTEPNGLTSAVTAEAETTPAKGAATLLGADQNKLTAKSILERKPESDAEKLFLVRVLVAKHLSPAAAEPLKGKERSEAIAFVHRTLEEAQTGQLPVEALTMAMALYTSESTGFKDDKKALSTLNMAVKKRVPFASAGLATIHLNGKMGLKRDSVKAIQLIDDDAAPRNAQLLALKASVLADSSFPETFDLSNAIATARMAYQLDSKDEMTVSLLSGLLMADKDNEANVKEGYELLAQWSFRVREVEAKEKAALALRAVEIANERDKPTIVPVTKEQLDQMSAVERE